MKVAELIEKLKEMPPELDVMYSCDYDSYTVAHVDLVEYKSINGIAREVYIR